MKTRSTSKTRRGRSRPRRRLALTPTIRVLGLVAAMTLAATTLYFTVLRGMPPLHQPIRIPWWALVPAFFGAELYPVHLHFRRETHTLSLADLAIVVGLFLLSPGGLIVAQFVGAGAALIVLRRRPIKIAFNLTEFAFATVVAVAVFRLLVPDGVTHGPITWGPALAGGAASALVGVLLVTLVIRLVGGAPQLAELPFVTAIALAGTVGSASVALAAVELLHADAAAVALLAAPAASCLIGFRAYARQRRRHSNLEFLYGSMRSMQSASELRSATRELLEAARRIVSAEMAEIVLLPRATGGSILRSALRGTTETHLEAVTLTEVDELALTAVSLSENALLLPRGRAAHILDPYLAQADVADAIVAPLPRTSGIAGMLVVGDRANDVSTFTDEDRKLIETLASHSGVVLENDQVREQLGHQAFHDALTQLPNRVLFAERVGEALSRRTTNARSPAVLFVDLDDFKTINDSLGHNAGDEVLVAVAVRITEAGGDTAFTARFGGDEFGILLDAASVEDAVACARRVLESLGGVIALHGRELRITPTIGVATAANGATTAEELLRNADVAMYAAKANGKRRYAVYEPEMHARARHRQELTTALEHAVNRDEIVVHYQPIIDLQSGRVFAFEALARWQHPDYGLLPPGSFVPLAEETGLTPAIARIVLREACRETLRWQRSRAADPPIAVTVNLSPVELQNPQFVSEIEATLEQTGLEAQSLILEITENAAMHDYAGTVARLEELRALGARIALDDFGTGYSSLSHLRELPIDIVKIAKPFIDGLGGAASDETFVQAILQIADALRLEVIAEGAEDVRQGEILGALGCRLIQGYAYARPLSATEADVYLHRAAQRAWRQLREVRQGRRDVPPAAGEVRAQ